MPHSLQEALSSFRPHTPGQARVQAFLSRNLHRLATLSLDDIAESAGVSQPTVTRAIRNLGYANSLELRTAASLHLPGRLAHDQVRRAAALIRNCNDLYIYAPEQMDDAVATLFKTIFPKTDVRLPMKPQIVRRYPAHYRTPRRVFSDDDAALFLALSGQPEGYHLEHEVRNACVCGASVLLVHTAAIGFPGIDEACHRFSLGLSSETNEALSIVYLTAAVAEIRHHAQQADDV